MLIFWCCHLQVDEEVAAWAADEATPTLEKIFSKFATCWINLFPSKPDKNLTCTVEELGQFKSFRQNSSNSSLSSSLEKILSISWNDADCLGDYLIWWKLSLGRKGKQNINEKVRQNSNFGRLDAVMMNK